MNDNRYLWIYTHIYVLKKINMFFINCNLYEIVFIQRSRLFI